MRTKEVFAVSSELQATVIQGDPSASHCCNYSEVLSTSTVKKAFKSTAVRLFFFFLIILINMNYPLIAKIIFNLLRIILASFSQLCFLPCTAVLSTSWVEWHTSSQTCSISPLPGTYCSDPKSPSLPPRAQYIPLHPLSSHSPTTAAKLCGT